MDACELGARDQSARKSAREICPGEHIREHANGLIWFFIQQRDGIRFSYKKL